MKKVKSSPFLTILRKCENYTFVNLHFLSYYFSTLNIFQGFSLNFAKTLGRVVEKLLNGSRVNSHRQLCFESKAFQQNRRSNFSHF